MAAEGNTGRFAGATIAYPDVEPTPKFAGVQVLNPFAVQVEPNPTDVTPAAQVASDEAPTVSPEKPRTPIFEPEDLPVFVGSRDSASQPEAEPQKDEFITPLEGPSESPSNGPQGDSEAISGDKTSIPVENPAKASEQPSKPVIGARKKAPTAVRKTRPVAGTSTAAATSIFHQDANVAPAVRSKPTGKPGDPQIAFFDPEPRPTGVASKSKEAGGRFVRLVLGVGFGIIAGLVAVGYLMVVFGPYKLTDLGLVREDTGIAINALPAGTEVTIVRNGTTPPSGLATLNPIILGVSHVTIDERTQLDDGTPAYQVTCIDGSCPTGITSIVPFSAVIGGPPGS
jgi:hypothetical protein